MYVKAFKYCLNKTKLNVYIRRKFYETNHNMSHFIPSINERCVSSKTYVIVYKVCSDKCIIDSRFWFFFFQVPIWFYCLLFINSIQNFNEEVTALQVKKVNGLI